MNSEERRVKEAYHAPCKRFALETGETVRDFFGARSAKGQKEQRA